MIMTIKPFLYVIVLPFTLYSLTCINYQKFIKNNKVTEIKILFLLVSISISYLVVNFLYDFMSGLNI